MDLETLIANFRLLGCDVNVVNTGDHRWKRGFVIDPRGTVVGRASIFHNELKHINWYWRGQSEDVVYTDFIMYQWRYLQHCGRVISESSYQLKVQNAELLRDLDYAGRDVVMQSLPKKKRRPLSKRDVREFIDLPHKAPWCDEAGVTVLDGDVIEVSDGRKGVVSYQDDYCDPSNQWRVDFGDNVLPFIKVKEGCHVEQG